MEEGVMIERGQKGAEGGSSRLWLTELELEGTGWQPQVRASRPMRVQPTLWPTCEGVCWSLSSW